MLLYNAGMKRALVFLSLRLQIVKMSQWCDKARLINITDMYKEHYIKRFIFILSFVEIEDAVFCYFRETTYYLHKRENKLRRKTTSQLTQESNENSDIRIKILIYFFLRNFFRRWKY